MSAVNNANSALDLGKGMGGGGGKGAYTYIFIIFTYTVCTHTFYIQNTEKKPRKKIKMELQDMRQLFFMKEYMQFILNYLYTFVWSIYIYTVIAKKV